MIIYIIHNEEQAYIITPRSEPNFIVFINLTILQILVLFRATTSHKEKKTYNNNNTDKEKLTTIFILRTKTCIYNLA